MLRNLVFAWGIASYVAALFCTVFLALSLLFWQPEGVFYYGLGLIASGVSLKLVVNRL